MAGRSLTRQLIDAHLRGGDPSTAGAEIELTIDQTLTQDATGTLVMQELEALELDRVRTEVSAQYVDHNLLQTDHRNADDHQYLLSACRRFGIWFSRPGNGVSHPVHMQRFGRPGATLLGSDSHSCAAGSLGMLAIGAGGLAVALAMAGEPFAVPMPRVRRVVLEGQLGDWCSAKDVILELLRRYDVDGGVGWVHEYDGDGLAGLSAMDRHVIANMGAELGCTTSVFPADTQVERFLQRQGRGEDFTPLAAEAAATYDDEVVIDLSSIEPLIALPSSPGKVRPVREVAGEPIAQAYIGSSANPGLRDFAVPAMMVRGQVVPAEVSFDVNPPSRQDLAELSANGWLDDLIRAGARIHQAGCNGCIGMGQAPATGRNSLRTVPRNFPGRSGTREDAVFLCSPETATASALRGRITDPRELDMDPPVFTPPAEPLLDVTMLVAPDAGAERQLVKGPDIGSLPALEPLGEHLAGPVLIHLGEDISTDEILPAGGEALPWRSNIPRISAFCFRPVDETFHERAVSRERRPFFVVGGRNYGQGSSREHAALAPYHLGLRAVIAISYARIHHQNLVNFGILPLRFDDGQDHARITRDDELVIDDLPAQLAAGDRIAVRRADGSSLETAVDLSERQRRVLRAGGLINLVKSGGE